MNLCDVRTVKELMARYNINFRKEFGQNFLTSEMIVSDIADACSVNPHVTVLEIGPGIGTLTRFLCEKYDHVIALEIDRGLIPVLGETMAEYDNFTLYNEDVMQADLQSILADAFTRGPVCVCANLPYYITSPIIMKLLECGLPFASITVMVQDEVASRLSSKAGASDYGAITAVVQYYAKVEKILFVSAGHFLPPPKVNSAVIQLTPYTEKPCVPVDESLFFRTVHAAFGQRRKTLLNAISSGFGELTKDQLRDCIVSCGFDENIRGERLSVADFVRLSDAIYRTVKG